MKDRRRGEGRTRGKEGYNIWKIVRKRGMEDKRNGRKEKERDRRKEKEKDGRRE